MQDGVRFNSQHVGDIYVAINKADRPGGSDSSVRLINVNSLAAPTEKVNSWPGLDLGNAEFTFKVHHNNLHFLYITLAFVRVIHRCRANSPHKGPVTRKCFHLMTSSQICRHWHATTEYKVNTMTADDLPSNWVMESAAMVLTQSSRNILDWAQRK